VLHLIARRLDETITRQGEPSGYEQLHAQFVHKATTKKPMQRVSG
jgi:hypothetical protein